MKWQIFTGQAAEEDQPAVITNRWMAAEASVCWYSEGQWFNEYGAAEEPRQDLYICILPPFPTAEET